MMYAKSIVKDNNWGLAGQCLRALQQQKIQDLTRTYITLSVSDIAEKVGFTGEDAKTEVEKNILEMVSMKKMSLSRLLPSPQKISSALIV